MAASWLTATQIVCLACPPTLRVPCPALGQGSVEWSAPDHDPGNTTNCGSECELRSPSSYRTGPGIARSGPARFRA
jgi:hypothetical protein